MTLYGPDGRTLARRETIPMSARHVRCLNDGRYFADHAEILKTVSLEVFCRTCVAAGLPSEITTTVGKDSLNFRCAHRSGYISRQRPSDFAQLLHELGWNVRCTRCQGEASGDNTKKDATFQVTCACLIRELDNPIIPKAQGTV